MNKSLNNINICSPETLNDLQKVLSLQEKNLKQNLPGEVIKSKGFVTVQHDLTLLEKMNNEIPQVIAKDGDIVIGYALVMTESFKEMIPVLMPMFKMF